MNRRISGDERRTELMLVAERLFANRPYADISVQEIADEAGVARGLIHHYFGGKDDVLAAVIREMIPERTPAPLDVSMPLSQRVDARLDMLIAALEHHSEGWLATLATGPNLPDGPLKEAADALWDTQYEVWVKTFSDVLEDNGRTRALYTAYLGLNQATCRMWLNGELSRGDAKLILRTALEALLEQAGPELAGP
ncbi:MAG: TetR/AcrR family transcriptional regulator [Actinomycetota bacterium]|nr:TetR/AcrR family transcriptional regulator [Actinomycetota bacterium]